MKRICRAINEGISLIDFDNDRFKKSTNNGPNAPFSFYNIKIGDYVYYNRQRKCYNGVNGDLAAVCVNDEPGKELYVAVGHPLLDRCCKWANCYTDLYSDIAKDSESGLENTEYITSKYSYLNNLNELDGTIWPYLKPNEYIPSLEELKIIFDNCQKYDLFDKIGILPSTYWTSTQTDPHKYRLYTNSEVFILDFLQSLLTNKHMIQYVSKDDSYRSIVLLKINDEQQL